MSTPEQTGPVPDGSARRHRRRRSDPASSATRRTTGRERHDEKITVYVSPDELVALEQARLVLRAEHGLAVDRAVVRRRWPRC